MAVVKKGWGRRRVKDMKWTKEEIHHQTWMSETANRIQQQNSTSSIHDIKENEKRN